MKETFLKLRSDVCKQLNCGITEGELVKQPGGQAQAPGDAWESYIANYKWDDVKVSVILQYKSPIRYREAQQITVGEYTFAIRLVIWDHNSAPNVSTPRVTDKGQLSGNLSKIRPYRNQYAYEVENLSKKIKYDDEDSKVGGVFQVWIPGSGKVWKADKAEDVNAFAAAVTSALKDLLPLAQFYVCNRKELFRA